MNDKAATSKTRFATLRKLQEQPVLLIGLLFGVLMPIVSAAIYPTYRHKMPVPWVEGTRLLEFQFVAVEVAIIFIAIQRGMSFIGFWRDLSADVRIAVLLMLIGMYVGSAMYSAEPASSLIISLITTIHLMFAVAAIFLFKGVSVSLSEGFTKLHASGLVLIALLTAWWFSFPPPLSQVPEGKIEWGNAVPGWIHARHFGSWTGAMTAAFAAKMLFEDKQKLDWTHAAYCLAAAMTVWSGTRAAILAIIVVTLILVIATRRFPSPRAIAIAVALTAVAVFAAWLVLPDHPAFYLYQSGDADSLKSMTSKRDELWFATFYRWLDSPWLGWGSGSTNWEVYIGWAHTQPHNAILQFLISWGVVGATGALWLIGRSVKAVHTPSLNSPIQLALLAMLYSLLFQSLFEGMLHYPRFIIEIIALFALLYALANRAEQSEEKEVRLPAG